MSDLHIYCDDNDWVIAESPADATRVQSEYADEITPEGEWILVPDDRPDFTIVNYTDDGGRMTRPVKEWIDIHGRGLLCSLDY